ncbi:hypothetical protein N7452_004172 [Penicillium brevicompactum]|uniref:Reverse transcriptase domain-containing protein n=1 Tax=Penicillium brevicompactum TaxID=5074 RepID=A0A9W9QXE5_PENBR|nr:hypothetical protein N7452_004172 [Penicillium brevicompactum]
MVDPHTGGPEPPPTDTGENPTSFSVEDFQPRVPIEPLPDSRKRTRSDGAFTPLESTGRVTTREVWKLIDSLKLTIHHQTALIESTKAEIEEVRHDQNVLRDQNEKLHEEIRAMRAQIEALPPAPSSRTWAAVAASGNVAPPQQTDSRPDKDLKCVRISTQRSFVDPADNNNSDGNTFGRYLPTDSANNHIRTALMNAPTTQDAQVAGIGTTKTGYVIRFKDTESAELARNNGEWLNELGNNTKMVKPRFGIVVHRTPTENFNLESANTQAIEKIMDENGLTGQGFQIEEVAWLKRKDKVLGKFASLGIWFDSAEGAERILHNGLLVGQRYIGISDTSRGHARKHHGADIARANMNGNDALRASERGASTAAENTQQETDNLNIMKSGPRMEALINDHQSQNLDVLLIQEPSITTYRTHVNHSSWRLYRPTTDTDTARFRSLIYVNRRVSTSSHRQILCDHPDVAAIKIWTSDFQILFFSVYIPSVPLCTDAEASAEPALTAIQNTITTALRDDQRSTSIVLGGDFNRHHPMWGGNHIQPRFIEDASDLITFFQANSLHSCLPRGTATYWSLSDPGRNSTIDQTVTDPPELLIKCHLYHENYGSDHRATYSEWNLQTHSKRTTQTRKAYERVDWNKIGEEVDDQELIENEDKARAFLDSFFPEMDTPEASSTTSAPLELPWQPLTKLEIERSLKAAKATTAPGEDNLPMLVWKQLWEHLKDDITGIFNASLNLGYHPKRWRNAKIVVLRKPGKPDYSVPGAYRPISLLNTLGKLLEAVVARRLSYRAEKHGLLPDTQFGGRPGRTTEQALLVLSNAIDRAWYKHKVVTLVSFDLKGAFNGVQQASLNTCLRAKGIPAIARKWIASFMSDR